MMANIMIIAKKTLYLHTNFGLLNDFLSEMKKTFLFISVLLMGALGLTARNTPQRSDYSFRSEVRTITEDGETRWDTIVVHLTDANGLTLGQLYSQAQPLDTAYWSKDCIGEITEEDWNFDGIPDLQVCTGPMNSFGNETYDVWLWDDLKHQFIPLQCDGEIYSPQVDYERKCIVSTWHLDDDLEIILYKWQNGKLVESSREQMSYSDLTDD